MTRREFTRNQKEQIIERSRRNGQICCERCELVLGHKPFEIDHIIPEALRPEADKQKSLTIAEGQLLGKACCHRGEDGKTNKDVKQIAKGKRQYNGHNGIKKRKGRPLPGTRASGIRKRMDGSVERW
ncbi:hypothetical protein IWQ49_006420 [Labrenzia sp. EL_126]|nr:hypothetical protein [Labrenzia sp. EL_126]